jgi:hypothetical protein
LKWLRLCTGRTRSKISSIVASRGHRPDRAESTIPLLPLYLPQSNIEIPERFQSKALRIIVDAPWYVPNNQIRRELQMTSVKEEIRRYSSQYSARLSTHPNDQILTLMEIPGNRRLRRHVPKDLPNRFLL